MPLDGNGTYQPLAPEFPAIPNTTILSADFNAIILDIAAALSNAIYRDGQAPLVANQSMGGFKLTNLADGSADDDSVNFKQVFYNPHFRATVDVPEGIKLSGILLTIDLTNVTAKGTLFDFSAVTTFQTGDLGVNGNLSVTGDLSGNGDLSITGTAEAADPPPNDVSNLLATTRFVAQTAFNAALPSQTGNAGKFVQTDGANARWVSLKGSIYFMGQN